MSKKPTETTQKPLKSAKKPLKTTQKMMKNAITKYFKECDGELAIDEESGMPIPSKTGGYIYEILPKPPTITGLAIAVGFSSKKELLEKMRENRYTSAGRILRLAISKVEEYAEAALINSGASGLKFFLSSNFEGWGNDEETKQKDAQAVLSSASLETLQKFLNDI